MDSVMDWHNLEHFFEKYILTDTKQEEIKDVIKELMICLEQNNTAEHNNRTLDVLPSNSTFSIPPSVPEKPMDLTFKPQINNVLSTAKLGCKLDLDFIVRNTWNCEYNPKTFPAITIRIRKPRSTARLFRNGTLVCAGATSTDESHRAARKFARIVQKLNFPVRLLNFQIKNIVSCGKFFPVHLADVRQAYSKKCSYHPELFPSLFFRGLPGVTATVSPSGSIILNGPRTTEELHKASEEISLILSPFRKK
ncbi:TATA-box-binding protein-like [Poecilia formosa]|uniref:TATA-box-binding protein-like n=1 Tax=Poecilia formosa TaxID=48698 RepID=UPI0007B937E5|nr:PREDICTED: TATA-box-binding protein-like [Poecilia formosa]